MVSTTTQYCMEDPEQAFVEYASSRTDEAGGKWYTFNPEQNNLGDTYNPSWKSHPNLRRIDINFMASQDARLSKFEADFVQTTSEMTTKFKTVLKGHHRSNRGALPSDTVKNLKMSTSLVLSARSYPTEDPQCSTISMVRSTLSRYIPSNKTTPVIAWLRKSEVKEKEPRLQQH
ncbi:hypothetical protein Tco_0070720 [Tanacetum coccineum]